MSPTGSRKVGTQRGMLSEDISERTRTGDFDYPRAKAGGLDVVFMSIYVPPKYEARRRAEVCPRPDRPRRKLCQEVAGQVRARSLACRGASQRRGAARSACRWAWRTARRSSTSSTTSRTFIGAASATSRSRTPRTTTSPTRPTTGKTPTAASAASARQVVGEMNRVGIMVDVSHISDAAFWQVIELSRAPVIASHSSCRHFTPGWRAQHERRDDPGAGQEGRRDPDQLRLAVSRRIDSENSALSVPKRHATVEQGARRSTPTSTTWSSWSASIMSGSVRTSTVSVIRCRSA